MKGSNTFSEITKERTVSHSHAVTSPWITSPYIRIENVQEAVYNTRVFGDSFFGSKYRELFEYHRIVVIEQKHKSDNEREPGEKCFWLRLHGDYRSIYLARTGWSFEGGVKNLFRLA